MDPMILIPIMLFTGLAAALYASVGHGGASAYLAIMALAGVPTATMRPTALALNLLVAGFATCRYAQAGAFNPRLFLSFAATGIPFAYLGGTIDIGPELYRPLLGLILWCAAIRLLWRPAAMAERPVHAPPLLVALPTGAGLGLLAGLTGTGGGIFLSPLILLAAWEAPRATSGVAAAFIFANSAAGLAGNWSSLDGLPAEMPLLLACAGTGALLGLALGARRLPQPALVRLLGVVLLVAGAKLLLT